MAWVAIFFWWSFALLFYTYFGYGALLFVFSMVKKLSGNRRCVAIGNTNYTVSLIVPVYDEVAFIRGKIENCLAIDYPPGKLQFIFITDGSTDGSDQIVKEYKNVIHLHEEARKGKMAAINKAMQYVTSEVVIFSDANTFLNTEAVKEMVKHYSDSTIGGVAGEKKINRQGKVSQAYGEGIYWQYEAGMKKLEAEFFTVIGAAGELFSMRTSLFRPLNENVILDDLVLSLKICLSGYKVAYEPKAFAIEGASPSLGEESKRKIRIAAGAYQSILLLSSALNFVKYPLVSFQFISRRVLRWIVSPVALASLFINNAILYFELHQLKYIFYLQLLFYATAFIGYLSRPLRNQFLFFIIPFYFVFMHACLVLGFFRFVTGGQSVQWEKAKR